MSRLRVSDAPSFNGVDGFREDAELGNIILEMFLSHQDEADLEPGTRPSFTEAITRSVIDDLGVIELALESGSSLDELSRIVQRMRHRLFAARWLDERTDRVREPEVTE